MKDYKTIHNTYAAWDYQREIEDLNKLSQQGWQLIRAGVFSSRFKRNENVCYRYQLDYQPNIEEKARYIETHREFGWEYVDSTFNGWHYFRKLYDPSLPEEEYEFFSDRASLKEMTSRWTKLGIVLVIVLVITALAELSIIGFHLVLPMIILMITFAVMAIVLARGTVIMSNPEKHSGRKGEKWILSVFLTVFILGMVGFVISAAARPHINGYMTADEMNPISAQLDEALLWNTMEIKYTDNYFVSAEVTADSPITFSVVDHSDNVVYTVTGSSIDEDDVRLRLSGGEYRIYLSDYAGGALDAHIELI